MSFEDIFKCLALKRWMMGAYTRIINVSVLRKVGIINSVGTAIKTKVIIMGGTAKEQAKYGNRFM
jgi:hypothetical protein